MNWMTEKKDEVQNYYAYIPFCFFLILYYVYELFIEINRLIF